jgi:putative copper export protein
MAEERLRVTDAAYELIEHMEHEAEYLDVSAGLALVTSLIVSGFLAYFMVSYIQAGAYGNALPFALGLLVSILWFAVSIRELFFLRRWRTKLERLRKREKQIVDEVLA